MENAIDILFVIAVITCLTLIYLRRQKDKQKEAAQLANKLEKEISARGGRNFTLVQLRKVGKRHYRAQYEDKHGNVQTHRIWRYRSSAQADYHWEPPLENVSHEA